MDEKYLDPNDVIATIVAGVMEEYQKFVEEEGEKSVGSDELRALSHEISLLCEDKHEYVSAQDISYYIVDDGEISQSDSAQHSVCQDNSYFAPYPEVNLKVLFADEAALKNFARETARDIIYQHRDNVGPNRDETLSIDST